jgi:hypothetical protein
VSLYSRVTVLTILLLSAAGPAAAQDVTVAANVPLASPSGVGFRDLSFGAVTPIAGQTVNVDVPAAVLPVTGSVHAGEFRYDVANARGLDFAVTVPAALAGPGVTTLPVAFAGTQYGGFCVTSGGSACALTPFDPGSPSTVRVCFRTLGSGACHPSQRFPAQSELFVYIGGSLSVPSNALAGAYSATVTVSIVQVY